VEAVNNEVLQGVPFREAYKNVGGSIADGSFKAPEAVNHTHEGSIGNLCNDKIIELMTQVIQEFKFQRVNQAISELVAP
jgi:argininosuccinate lyase